MAQGIGARSFHVEKNRSFTVGAAAIVSGQICKITAGVLVTADDNDKQGVFYIALQNAAIGAQCVVSTDSDIIFDMPYTGSDLAVGASCGIDSGILSNTADTNYLVTCLEVLDSVNKIMRCKFYQLTA